MSFEEKLIEPVLEHFATHVKQVFAAHERADGGNQEPRYDFDDLKDDILGELEDKIDTASKDLRDHIIDEQDKRLAKMEAMVETMAATLNEFRRSMDNAFSQVQIDCSNKEVQREYYGMAYGGLTQEGSLDVKTKSADPDPITGFDDDFGDGEMIQME